MNHPDRPPHDRPPPGERFRPDLPQPPAPTAWHPSTTAHAVTAAAAAGLVVLFAVDAAAPPAPSANGYPLLLFTGTLLAGTLLALIATRTATTVAFRRTLRQRSPTGTDALALSRRIAVNSAVAIVPGVYGPLYLAAARPPAPLTAALIAVVAAALLLDLRDATRLATRLATARPGPDSTTATFATAPTGGVQLLPPGGHRILRRRHRLALTLLILVTATTAGLIAATAATELGRAPARPLTSTLQVLAAAAVTVTALGLVQALRHRGRSLLTGPDAIRLDTLAEVTTSLRRSTIPATTAAVLTAAAVLVDPAAPLLAAGRALPLLLLLLLAAQQAAAITPQYLGEILRPHRDRPAGSPGRPPR